MRLTGTREWIVLGALVLYIAFTPGFPAVRAFLSTGGGKAASLALIIAVWKYVSEPVALLLAINHVRCAGMREGANETLSALVPHCPTGFTLDKNTNMCEAPGKTPVAGKVCTPPNTKWNAETGKCGPTEGFDGGGPPEQLLAGLVTPSGPTGAASSSKPKVIEATGATGSPPPPPPPPPAREPFYGGFQPNGGSDSFAPVL